MRSANRKAILITYKFYLMKILLRYIFLLLLLGAGFSYGRIPVKIDSSRIEPVTVSKDVEKKIFDDKGYAFKPEEAKRSRNFIKDIIDWFTRDKIEDDREREDRESTDYDDDPTRFDGNRNFWDSRTVGNFIILLCVLAAVAGIVYLIVTKKIKKVFAPKPQEVVFDFSEIAEDIETLNIDKMIETAKQKGDYRLATRWWYLKILKKLTMENLIIWKPHKTNFDYYRELQKTKYIQEFRQASHVYEYVWYGEMPVNQEVYNKYTPQLDAFEKSIHA